MFLTMKRSLLIALCVCGTANVHGKVPTKLQAKVTPKISKLDRAPAQQSAAVQKLNLLEAGNYVLETGPTELCSSFSLEPADLNGRTLTISSTYSFITLNSNRSIESDIDATCEFREQSARGEEKANEVSLSRLNEEVCAGKTTSRTMSTLLIRAGELRLTHHIAGAEPYTCVWKKH